MLLVPRHAATHTLGQLHLRRIAQLLACRRDVAAPVALSHDVVLVVVEGCHPARTACHEFAAAGDDAQQPERSRDAYPPGVAQFLADEVAEGRRQVHLAVAEEVTTPRAPMLQGQEHSLDDVSDIDEGDVLLTEADGEVGMCFDALEHHVVVALAWSVDAGRSQDDVWEGVAGSRCVTTCLALSVQGVQPLFGLEFAASVGGIGLWRVAVHDVTVGLLLAYGSHDAQRADVDEALHRHLQRAQRIDEVFRALGIDATEVFSVQAFGDAGSMYDVVEAVVVQLLSECAFRGEIQFDEVYPVVAQERPGAALPDGSPRLEATP